MANAMFEATVTNGLYDQTLNVAGLYGTGTGDTFSSVECPAGTLCVTNGLTPSEGYEDFNILNGNTYYFNAATSGTVTGYTGDETGLYAFNNYNVNVVGSGDLKYNLGANTLGISLPAGDRGTFTMLCVGKQYTWGADNFTAVPTSAQSYATVASGGKWTPAAAAPTMGGVVYAKIMRTKPVNEAASYWGEGYVLEIHRAAVSAS